MLADAVDGFAGFGPPGVRLNATSTLTASLGSSRFVAIDRFVSLFCAHEGHVIALLEIMRNRQAVLTLGVWSRTDHDVAFVMGLLEQGSFQRSVLLDQGLDLVGVLVILLLLFLDDMLLQATFLLRGSRRWTESSFKQFRILCLVP